MKQAINMAVDSCIDKGVLADILVRNRSEVMHMLLTEYDEKKHLANTFAEGFEEGEQRGYRKGEQRGYKKGEHGTQIRMIKNLIQKYSIPEVSELLELEISYVDQIARLLNQFPQKNIAEIVAIVNNEEN